jgi:hypothetical protein
MKPVRYDQQESNQAEDLPSPSKPSFDADDSVTTRPRRWAGIAVGLVLMLILSVAVPAIRRPILRAAGWALVATDPVRPADVIVLAVGADGAGVLEAADLVHSGIASRVAVFADTPDTAVEQEFIRRGLLYEGAGARSIRELKALGITAVEPIPGYVTGSEDEGPALAEWCKQQRLRAVVVITTSDHSRRLRRMLRRSMKGHDTLTMVRSARYSIFDPDSWWQSRRGIRTEIEEVEKLLLDIVRHPIP